MHVYRFYVCVYVRKEIRRQFSSVNTRNCIHEKVWFAFAFSMFPSKETIAGRGKLGST